MPLNPRFETSPVSHRYRSTYPQVSVNHPNFLLQHDSDAFSVAFALVGNADKSMPKVFQMQHIAHQNLVQQIYGQFPTQ